MSSDDYEKATPRVRRNARITFGLFVLGCILTGYAAIRSPDRLTALGVVGVLLAGPAMGLLTAGAEP